MRITTSYDVEIKHCNRRLWQTLKIYNDAVTFCVGVLETEWETLSGMNTGVHTQERHTEGLLHTTKNHTAKYPDFDVRFYKMPSYMRRAVIRDALGYLNSYHSHLDNWESDGKKTKKPTMQTHLNKFPTFYRDNTYMETDAKDTVRLKLYIDNDWKFTEIKLKHTDMQYIRNHTQGKKMSCPTLERRNKKWFLRFCFTEEVGLTDTNLEDRKILAVDLGINTDATCSVMKSDGTILARKFINHADDKDQLYHTLNKIKKTQKKYANHNTSKLWRTAVFRNQSIAEKTAKAIVETAVFYECDVIVFEHLDMQGKIKGRNKQKLHLWKKKAIQHITELHAHQMGIRISTVCAWGTSKLAFDGSGTVIRGKEAGFKTNETCVFTTGKVYNCDLSASYNIGARYFIREIQKTISVKKWSCIEAKVPQCKKRTGCTLHTLLEVNKAA